VLGDIRHGIRVLASAPGFTVVAILTIALGIALNTAMFTVVNSALLEPPPYKDPEHIVVVWNTWPQKSFPRLPLFNPEFLDFERNTHVFTQVSGFKLLTANLTGRGEPERLEGARASASFFPLLGVAPLLGRTYTTNEDKPGSDRVVVLSYGLWQRRFAGDPAVVGRSIVLDGANRTVVGVMPPQFRFSMSVMLSKLTSPPVDFWVPLAMKSDERETWGSVSVYMLARLKPAVTRIQAETEVAGLRAVLFKANDLDVDMGSRVALLPDEIHGDLSQPLWILCAAVGCVLLIACANLGGLLLARGATRVREVGIRLALGASRAAIIRQLVVESLLLSSVGGIMGTIASGWLARLFLLIGPESLQQLAHPKLDFNVLAFALVLSILTGLLFGVAPAWRLSKTDVNGVLVESGRAFTARHSEAVRGAIVVGQLSFTVVILAAAMLLVRSLVRVVSTDPGFVRHGILSMDIPLAPSRYPDAEKQSAFFEQALQRVELLPGVTAGAIIESVPFTQAPERFIQIEDEPVAQVGHLPLATTRFASPDYLRVTGISLRAGRWLSMDDRRGTPGVAIADELFVRAHWPRRNPIGKHIRIGGGSTGPWITIVGVVGATHQYGLDVDARPGLYLSYLQDSRSKMSLLVRTAGDPLSLAGPVRSAIRSIDRNQPVAEVRTIDQLVARSVSNRKFQAALLSTFGSTALLLAALGVFGLLSWSVAQRTREIAVRVALGATRLNVLYLVIARVAILVGSGLLIGTVAALVIMRALRSVLFQVGTTDPVSFAVVAAALLVMGVIASSLPAWRVLRVQPAEALRVE
jgi:putative ABC transport system permease protein